MSSFSTDSSSLHFSRGPEVMDLNTEAAVNGRTLLSEVDDVPVSPIPELPESLLHCEGIPRRSWATKFVILLGYNEEAVGEGVVHCVDSDVVVGAEGSIGEGHVAVQITSTFDVECIPPSWCFSLRSWNISEVVLNGFTLYDHLKKDEHNSLVAALTAKKRKGVRPYESVARNAPRIVTSKAEEMLSAESIQLVSSKVCCKRNCLQPFPREKIAAVRQQLWGDGDFKFKSHLKLEVHRQFHGGDGPSRLVTIEGVDVCAKGWQIIMGVPKTTFYRKKDEVEMGKRAGPHGNLGLKKPRPYTQQAAATLKCLVENAADHMPHKTTSLSTGEKVVSRTLPSSWKWKDSIDQINQVNVQLSLRPISQSSLSKIRRANFPHYSRKAPGDNFSRCSVCDKYEALAKAAPPRSSAETLWVRKLKDHLADQRSHRELYYANRTLSIQRPNDVLTIIHDKMDHAKTASPLFSHKTKANDALMKLPVAVTGMIAHGHGDVRYAHYGLDIYPSDCNHTVGSIMRLFRDLEGVPKCSSRSLFSGSGSSSIFEALLEGKEACVDSLMYNDSASSDSVSLPPILNVQLDNAASDNKNRFMFCFWSLLIARGIFREIYVNFLLVGHTHEDIDAMFGRWSMKLKENDFPTIPLLMKSFMDAETQPVIPHLIEEVPDFKGFIESYIADGDEVLVGHCEGQQFKFYLHESGWPMMQYKMKCTDSDWLPIENGGIKLWKEDVGSGLPLLPSGEPKPLQPIPMRNLEEIMKGIGGFVKLWRGLCEEDLSGEYRRRHERLIKYWEVVQLALFEPIQSTLRLRNGFWPSSRVPSSLEDEFMGNGDVREAFGRDPHFIGRKCDRPSESFRPARDIYAGYFVILRPHDNDGKPFWVARALTGFNDDREHPGCIEIQFYMPASKCLEVQQTYIGWDSEKSFKWRVDDKLHPQWVNGDSVMTSWKSSSKASAKRPVVSINAKQIDIIRQSLLDFQTE